MLTRRRRLLILLLLPLFFAGSAVAKAGTVPESPPDAAAILEHVAQTYRTMESFQAEGTVTGHTVGPENITPFTTDFTLRLMRPHYYRITWSNRGLPFSFGGAVWSTGDQPRLFISGPRNVYFTMASHELALAGATGISGGAAHTIPALFLGLDPESPLERIKDPVVEGVEEVNGVACYVVGGTSRHHGRETYWISTDTYHILRYSVAITSLAELQEDMHLHDHDLEETLAGMGLENTPENRERLKAITESPADLTSPGIGFRSTQEFRDIASPAFEAADFANPLPENAVEKRSLFEALFEGK
ncbi:MAG: hypothetical protein EA425_14500 [Puniceicoccaceae bacterium]|nr:MAG: hypothetical protein EA425_14500 [Puniceicoccaceae bacterium]